jgi:hypothetical protein
VVELEPVEKEWGSELSAPCEERLEEAVEWIRREVHSEGHTGNGRHKEVRNT